MPDATPARSEVVAVPGNVGLDAAAKADRVASYYGAGSEDLVIG